MCLEKLIKINVCLFIPAELRNGRIEFDRTFTGFLTVDFIRKNEGYNYFRNSNKHFVLAQINQAGDSARKSH